MEEIKKQTVACIRFRQKKLESSANTAGLQTWLEERMKSHLDIEKVIGIVCRCLKGAAEKDEQAIRQSPTANEREAVKRLLLLSSMGETGKLWMQGKLESLNPKARGGILYKSGRFTDEKMMEMMGCPDLPILSSRTRLAELIVVKAHNVAHTWTYQVSWQEFVEKLG